MRELACAMGMPFGFSWMKLPIASSGCNDWEWPLTEMGPISPQRLKLPTAINGSYTCKTKPDALSWMCSGNASKNGKDCCIAVVFESPSSR